MVGLAPGRGDGALREGAALVPGRDGLADVGREDPGGAADVQDPALAAEQDRDDVGVAGEFAHGGGGDGAGERQRSGALVAGSRAAEPAEEVAVVDGGHDLGPESAGRGQPSGGEGGFAGADQAVEQPLRPGALVEQGSCSGRYRPVAAPTPALMAAAAETSAAPVPASRSAPAPASVPTAARHPAPRPRCCPLRCPRPLRCLVRCGGWWRCS